MRESVPPLPLQWDPFLRFGLRNIPAFLCRPRHGGRGLHWTHFTLTPLWNTRTVHLPFG